MKNIAYFDTPAVTALRIKNLLDLIDQQLTDSLDASGIQLQASATGIVQALHNLGPLSTAELASTLNLSHQLTTQRINKLIKRGVLQARTDPNDRRCRRIELSAVGQQQAARLQLWLESLKCAYTEAFDEIGVDALDVINRLTRALHNKPMTGRIARLFNSEEKTP